MTSTRVAILAAGCGSRLAPLTDDRPKCLIDIGRTSPLGLMLQALDRPGTVDEILLVVGHARAQVESFLAERPVRVPIRLIFNPRYDTANNIYSAHLLRERCGDGFLLLNSDVVCDPDILEAALADEQSFLVVDPTRPPRPEAMKVRFLDGRLHAIDKPLDPTLADGEYVGIARFDARAAEAFFRATTAILAEGGSDAWYEAAIERAAREVRFGLRSTAMKPWIEIDDHADLERARREILPRLGKKA